MSFENSQNNSACSGLGQFWAHCVKIWRPPIFLTHNKTHKTEQCHSVALLLFRSATFQFFKFQNWLNLVSSFSASMPLSQWKWTLFYPTNPMTTNSTYQVVPDWYYLTSTLCFPWFVHTKKRRQLINRFAERTKYALEKTILSFASW